MPPSSNRASKERLGGSPNPKGGGLPGGMAVSQDEMPLDGGRGDKDKKEEDGQPIETLEALTLSDYNRWLVVEEKFAVAEGVREQRQEGELFRKARDDRHRERGQSRQQNTTEQMKEAKTRVDSHRRANLDQGSNVKRDVIAWNLAKVEEKEAWKKYGQATRETLKVDSVNRQEMVAKKKNTGAAVKKEIDTLLDDVRQQRAMHKNRNHEKAETVRSQTADTVIDGSKKHFFLQRRAAAKETSGMVEQWNEQRSKNRLDFIKNFQIRAAKVRGARDGAKNMRDELKRQKQEEAAAIRDRRAGYAEARQALLTDQQLAEREAVNNNIAATFVPAESTRRMIQHPHYQELTAVIVDPTSAVSREIAASPKRTRRPISGGTAAALTMSGQDSKRDTRRV